ncbi:MAG: TraR/DksA C4-type zinc finger protein [Nitriliruptorales bacterium]
MARQIELTPEALARLRKELLAEREELLSQTLVLDATAVVGMWRDSGYDDDYADTGSATFERERAQSLALNARRILVQIDEALRRMDAGSYGLCERCGEPIEPERLEALPYATLCLADKQLDERTV